MERKNFLKTFAFAAAAGPMIIDGCKKDNVSTSTSTTSTTTSTGTCVVTPTEVEGPYPYVGGESTNPLDRSSVIESQVGVALALNFVVVNTNDNCNVVQNARVDIWHCNNSGYYSGYANQSGILGSKSYVGETWLRGYQLSDSAGIVKFSTFYPGWYAGRATHIHIEVFINGVLKKTGQVAFPESISNVVHVSSLYVAHGVNTTSNSADSIFGNSATDLANETVSITGSVSAGYAASYTIGLPL